MSILRESGGKDKNTSDGKGLGLLHEIGCSPC